MKKIAKLWAKLKDILIVDERKQINDYLNQATDVYDLEYRMRQVDKHQKLIRYY